LKYLVVIALVALLLVLLVLLLRRLRPYLRIAQEFIKTLRNFQQMSATRANPRNQQPEKLVCCETCGTWIPIGRSLTIGSSDSVYCSTECLSAKKRRKQATS
jgi:type II secretory pathway pseudopilin PulG